MVKRIQEMEVAENRRHNLDPIFPDESAERFVESVAVSEQKFIETMVGDIKKNVNVVKAMIIEYNSEYDMLKEVITKSVT